MLACYLWSMSESSWADDSSGTRQGNLRCCHWQLLSITQSTLSANFQPDGITCASEVPIGPGNVRGVAEDSGNWPLLAAWFPQSSSFKSWSSLHTIESDSSLVHVKTCTALSVPFYFIACMLVYSACCLGLQVLQEAAYSCYQYFKCGIASRTSVGRCVWGFNCIGLACTAGPNRLAPELAQRRWTPYAPSAGDAAPAPAATSRLPPSASCLARPAAPAEAPSSSRSSKVASLRMAAALVGTVAAHCRIAQSRRLARTCRLSRAALERIRRTRASSPAQRRSGR